MKNSSIGSVATGQRLMMNSEIVDGNCHVKVLKKDKFGFLEIFCGLSFEIILMRNRDDNAKNRRAGVV